MGESLNPSPLSRALQVLRPDANRMLLARRIAAAVLVVLAGVAAVRADPAGDHTDVVVAARDLAPGIELTATDVRLATLPSDAVPDGAQLDLGAVLASRVVAPVRRGEVVTDVRLLGRRLAEAAAGPDARFVPLHVADAALLDLVRPGDVADVLAAPTDGGPDHPRVIATDAVVVMVSEKQKGNPGDRVVLVALPAAVANRVAGAGLTDAVALTLH